MQEKQSNEKILEHELSSTAISWGENTQIVWERAREQINTKFVSQQPNQTKATKSKKTNFALRCRVGESLIPGL